MPKAAALVLWMLMAMALCGCSPQSVHHQIHWIVCGHDLVWYHDRTYIQPQTEPLTQLTSEYGPLYPTGERVIGLPVLDTGAGMASAYVPTVLMLRKDTQTCIVYALSGGP